MTVSSENTVKYKLALGFLLVFVLYVSFGVFSLMEIHTLSNLTKIIYERLLVVSNAALNAEINMIKMHRSMKDVVLSRSVKEFEKASNEVNKQEQLVYEQFDFIEKRIIDADERNLEKSTKQLFADWKPIREEVFLLINSNRRDEAASITKGKGADHVAKLEDGMSELTSYARKKTDNFMQLSERRHSIGENISIILVLVGAFLSAVIAFFTVKHVLKIEKALFNERNELQIALSEIKTLSGLLPICASCKKIRDDKGYWNQIEVYIRDHSEAKFTHSLCPPCIEKLYGHFLKEGD